MKPKWLNWAKQLQSLAQAGLTYSKDKYDIERFQQIRNLSVEILSEYTGISNEKIEDLFCNEIGYQTPKIDIRGAIFKENKILLVKESVDGCWSMPGGWAEFNLSIKENIIKEAREEAGLNVVPKRLIAVLDRNKHNEPVSAYGIYKIFVLCELIDGAFEKNIETEESGFFSLADLPPLSVERNTKKQIEMCFNSKSNDKFFTIFD
ncbi:MULTISPECIES: NUDIX hydrolase N-terminal domain-containing protein [Pelosinus]|jgi:ADP-ribose pyrophosphatase YjhB (NUDIX family)|uniref:NUDIX hydrolase n=1 Tax=Pelosinus fermentans B4 TaxID=1149862 RepID=I9LE03_9FIRM|nr:MULTISPECIES: NUDIX hydrolase [Pelosinus]EIW18586.1 NUDIX hydrolase [Pelosinus fermentans B4]EIW24365.1 NUDIX hydrolase [Pelosinus fermentans A11]OAM94342.1 NUDIX hydrolase [Pelosinus fermentans DSM 17108]SDR06650.1 ADP-ribose pyrophosphatase YjhB, NUDIX family [Pelosinus fermentans]